MTSTSKITSVSLKNVTIKYGETTAVKDLNLEIKKGELFILLGPSGCGKTTTLLGIAGLIKIAGGEVLLGEEVVTSPERDVFERPQDRDVAVVFQDYAIYPHMTVFKNIAFPLEIQKVTKSEIKARVEDVTQRLGINDLLNRKPSQLSGGQRQRVALGRAIVREPRIFLMDEPLSNLDAKLRIYARAELKKLHEELGTTIVYVTHDQMEAMSIGDKIAILKDGILQQVGTPNEVYHNPRNMFVAGFIGSPPINILEEATLVEREGTIFVDLGPGFSEYELSDGMEVKSRSISPDIVVGIRPEHIKISLKRKENANEAKIHVIEPVGREFIIHFLIREKPFIAVTSNTHDELRTEQKVWLLFDEKTFQIFDRKTEMNIRLKK